MALAVAAFLICLAAAIACLIVAALQYATGGDGVKLVGSAALLMAASALSLLFAWLVDTFRADAKGSDSE